jgi:hypothetical protein
VALALLGALPPIHAPPGPPALAPELSWLRGVQAEGLLRGSEWLFRAPAWRAWWVRCVEVLLAAGQLPREAVLLAALGCRHAGLLRQAGAPAAVVRLVDPAGGLVRLPPAAEEWSDEANPLLATLMQQGALLERLEAPVADAAWEWLEQKLTGETSKKQIHYFRERMARGEPLARPWLQKHARLLTPAALLAQIAAWARRPEGPDRRALLPYLLRQPQLADEKRAWLQSLLVACEPLPPAPRWSVTELAILLPLLDPVRDVLREVLARPQVEPREAELLPRLCRQLHGVAPPPPPSEAQRRLRPDWVAALGRLPGWEKFAAEAPAAPPTIPGSGPPIAL